MSSPSPGRPTLRVFGQKKDHYIPVPHQWAVDLRTYLQRNGVFTGHAQPFDGDTFSLALPRTADAELVQSLLDRWRGVA